jgi:hypothetical protein
MTMYALTHSTKNGGHGGRPAHAVAHGLGWFSVGLGLAECLMPQTMARAVGLPGKESLVRAFGIREVLSGMGILMSRDPEPWIWSRVAGDSLDLGALSAGLRKDNPHLMSSVVATIAVAQVTAVDFACAKALAGYRKKAMSADQAIDYRDRSGMPKPAQAMRGAALSDFTIPREYRIPEALRPWERHPSPTPETPATF